MGRSESKKKTLAEYRRKRSADRTPEPFGGPDRIGGAGGGMFVVHKHAARRLHYDFRLEMEGVLRSWAIPKGPSLDPAIRRLAVMVEDHPLDYADFEGVIPAGNYGAGAVIVWDRGAYRAIDPPGDAAGGVRAGKLDIEMRGFKLNGAFTMVRMKTRGGAPARDAKPQWLLIKKRDGYAATGGDIGEQRPRSVLSGLTVEEMREARAITPGIEAELGRLGAPALRAELSPGTFRFALAKLVREPVEGDEWLFELKYDGVRALAVRDGGAARIFARSGAEITASYPEVALALGALPAERFALDGEIIAPGADGRPNFQLLQRRIQARDAGEIARFALAEPVFYHVFDMPGFGRFDMRGLALETRKALLRRLVRDEGPIRYADHHVGGGREFYKAVEEAGLEGVVAKRRDSPYPAGRTGAWLKIKCPRSGRFVIGGWTEPAGSRTHFGALLLGQYEAPGVLRFVGRVGTGFDEDRLRAIGAKMRDRETDASPFRRARAGEPRVPRGSHFCAPAMVCAVRYTEWTDEGALRHPSFIALAPDADPPACVYDGPGASREEPTAASVEAVSVVSPPGPGEGAAEARTKKRAVRKRTASAGRPIRAEIETEGAGGQPQADAGAIEHGLSTPDWALWRDGGGAGTHRVRITNPGKIFWPAEGYTKSDLAAYYEAIAPWMLPYLKDRPVVLTRYPDGIEGKSFFQKDAPAYAPAWIRRERIYSEESKRDIAYFILESAEALVYAANMGAIPIHIWSSRVQRLDSPDWLLFDIDPKGSTTAEAVRVAQTVGAVLREAGMRPCVKTSGQAGIHVAVGLRTGYTYEQARMFSELVARIVVGRMVRVATLERDIRARAGRVYIDYLQLWQGKTIAAPFAVRPQARAPVSAPLRWAELRTSLDPESFNIRTMAGRMGRLGSDPFLGVLEDRQEIEPALPKLESLLRRSG